MNNYESSGLLDIPREYHAIQLPKKKISNLVKQTLKDRELTYRQACERIEGLNYTQLSRVTSGTNYTIDTLLTVLDVLDIELEVKKKKE